MPAGSFTTPSSSSTASSVSMPSIAPPIAEACAASSIAPPIHFCMKQPATRSPTLMRLTPGPTATTSPAPSDSGIRSGLGAARAYCASMVSRSR